MKNKLKCSALVLLIAICFQCTQEETTPQAQEIGLEAQDENHFKGIVTVDNVALKYAVTATADLIFDVRIAIDNKSINAIVNYNDESIAIDGHDHVFKEFQKEALLKMGSLISDYILATKEGDISMAEYTLLTLTEYWGKSPTDYVYTKRNVVTEVNTTNLKSRNEGITCIRRNTYVNAEYDDARGNQRDRVRVGSKPRTNYGCMGRCGADCGRWWIPSAWTKDCMDHDQCSNVNNASGGASDRNCGDEFNEAADDYVFGVIRGCRG